MNEKQIKLMAKAFILFASLAAGPILQRVSLVGKSREFALTQKTPEACALRRSSFLDTRRGAVHLNLGKAAKDGGLIVSPWFAQAHQKAGASHA